METRLYNKAKTRGLGQEEPGGGARARFPNSGWKSSLAKTLTLFTHSTRINSLVVPGKLTTSL